MLARSMLQRGIGRRLVHTVPVLPYDTSEGIQGLYSPHGFQTAWTDYQTLVVNKLSRATAESSNATRFPFHILLDTARNARQAHIFNYASQAHNNHLFFLQLRGNNEEGSPEANKPSAALQKRIAQVFGSLDGLRRAIDAEAATILDQGYVFLVEKPDKTLGLVAINGAGTPYSPGRTQQVDLNAPPSPDDEAVLRHTQQAVEAREKNKDVALLCLNLWQHAYVPDFGVAGREKFIDAWWAAIDWRKVSSRLFA